MEFLDAIHMSLDDYIKVKGLDRQYEKPKEIFSESPKKTDFKSRNKGEQNEDDNGGGDGDGDDRGDNDDVFMKDSSEIEGLHYMKADFNDVYSKSLNENTSNSSDISWKFEPSNVNGADVKPPIVPHNAPRKQQFFKKNNGGGRYQKKNNNYGNRKQYKNNNKNRGQRQNHGNNGNGNGNGNYGGGAFVKNFNQSQRSSEKKIPKYGLLTARARALAMQGNAINIQQQRPSGSVQSLNSEESTPEKLALSRPSSAVFNIDQMPLTQNNVDTFAGNFMNFLNTYENFVHKPSYDLQIQGKIAEIQNKMIHCSNTGMVMPQSGTGIMCKIKPHASATPLTFRHC